MSNPVTTLHWGGKKPSPMVAKVRKQPDYSGKVGGAITTHERLKELFELKKAVFIFGKPIPVAVVFNLQYGYICQCLNRSYIREYDPKGGFPK